MESKTGVGIYPPATLT